MKMNYGKGGEGAERMMADLTSILDFDLQFI